MRRIMTTLLAGAVMAGISGAAFGDPISVRDAKRVLYKGDKFIVQAIAAPSVDRVTMVQVESLISALKSPEIAKQMRLSGLSLDYYGAIAVVPNRALDLEKTMGFSNGLHSPEAAAAFAVNACRKLSGSQCVAVALILPKRYKPGSFTLSMGATDGFRSSWGRPNEPQYLAYSLGTGAYTTATGVGADAVAIENCNAKAAEAGSRDCVIGIAAE